MVKTITSKNLQEIINTKFPDFPDGYKSVCSRCYRYKVEKPEQMSKPINEFQSNNGKCFLEQGYICLGSVTPESCGIICPNKTNSPCLGCKGGFLEPKDIHHQLLDYLFSLNLKFKYL